MSGGQGFADVADRRAQVSEVDTPSGSSGLVSASATTEVHEFEVDGVRCFWSPSHGAMTAGLIFGIGSIDERFGERGFAQIIAQLATPESQLANVAGRAEWTRTSFQATGPRDDVQDFLRMVLRSLNQMPYQGMENAAPELVRQSLIRSDMVTPEALSLIYGFQGPGTVSLPATGLLTPEAGEIDAWKQKFFVKENAAAFFHGPKPVDLSFNDLRSGRVYERRALQRILHPSPMRHRTQCEGPTVVAPIATSRTSSMIVEIAEGRLRQRMAERVDPRVAVVAKLSELDGQVSLMNIAVDARPEHHDAVFEVMHTELHDLATSGPARSEILRTVKRMDDLHAGRLGDRSLVEVRDRARNFVNETHQSSYREFRSELPKLTATAVSYPLLQSLSAAMWTVPLESSAGESTIPNAPSSFRQVASRDPRDLRPRELRLGFDFIELRYDDRVKPLEVSSDELVGVVVYENGDVALWIENGRMIQFAPDEFGAGQAVGDYLSKLAPGVVVRAPAQLLFASADSRTPVAESLPVPAENTAPSEHVALSAPVMDEPTADQENNAEQEGTASSEQTAPESALSSYAAVVSDGADGVPGDEITYCYPSAIQFAEAVMAEAWPLVERLYAGASPDEQVHLVHVASSTLGSPTRFDPWVATGAGSGLALTIRGAAYLRCAWNQRLIEPSDTSKKARLAFSGTLELAEQDLVLATLEMEESPVPWVPLLEVTRNLARPRAVAEQRYIAHVERGALLAGHLEFQQFVSKKWAGSHRDMWDHAEFVCNGAPEGSPEFAIAAMAFIEHWLDECQTGSSAEDGSLLLEQIGKTGMITDAIDRSYGSDAFDLLSVASAKALETFFAYYWSLADFSAAAELVPKMGKRYSGMPMGYFTNEPWSVVRSTARQLAKNGA